MEQRIPFGQIRPFSLTPALNFEILLLMANAYMSGKNKLDGKRRRTIFVVVNSNWKCEISLDENGSQFRDERPFMEAAIRAVEVFKGIRSEPRLTLFPDCRGQKPTLATIMIVYEKSLEANNAALVYAHFCLEKIGLHKESTELRASLEPQNYERQTHTENRRLYQ